MNQHHMDEWGGDLLEIRKNRSSLDIGIFLGAAVLALVVYLIFGPDIDKMTKQTPLIIDLMFAPSFGIGFLYGLKMTDRVMQPSESRSPLKRAFFKGFLFLFMMGAIFTSVSFALHGGAHPPHKSIFSDGLIPWATEFIQANGGLTFLIVSSITIMAAATKRIVGMEGIFSKIFTFVGTYIFFSMLALTFSHTDPSHSQVYLYAFYQAGIVGGIFYQMNKITTRANIWEDYNNGF
jgi:magnesium-transporting ATPase (P-type)